MEVVSSKQEVHWPAGDLVSCACPHCNNVDQHQISMVREWGENSRGVECGACYGEYRIETNFGEVTARKLPKVDEIYLIRHHYDLGDQSIAVKVPADVDAKRIAIYMQFQAEEWFGAEKMVTNLGIAAAMVTFYGCKHAARSPSGEVIDMYADREAMCETEYQLMADCSLHRVGLREFLSHHLDG